MKKTPIKFLICCMYLLSKLSLCKVQYIGRFVGRICLKYDKRTVRDIDTNLSLCFPEKSQQERERIRNARLEYLGQIAFELSHIWVKDSQLLLSYLQPTYDNHIFEAALKSDEGVIFLFPHLGNWEMMSCYLSQFRTPTLMYSPQKKSKELDTFISDARRRVGANLAPANIKGVTQIIKSLKQGGLIGILPDQVPQDGGGVYCPFYNHQAYTMTLAHRLAKKTHAKVFIGAAFGAEAGFKVLAEPIGEAFYDDDLEVSAKILNKSIESLISRHPEQYQWEYKRFKKQLDNQRFYVKMKC
ncbi:MAG: lysophospholipid acyltransferase family protein [Marinomonas sp.]